MCIRDRSVIARKADGAMRDALSIFDQVAASSRGMITYQSAIENLNVLDFNYYNRLLDCFLAGKVLDTWLIYKEIRDRGFDSHFFINGLADYLRDLMVACDPSTMVLLEADDEARAAMAAVAAKCSPDFIYRAMNLCNDADLNYRTASNKQFLVELTLAKICQLLSPSQNDGGAGEGRLQKIQTATASTAATPNAGAPNVSAATPTAAANVGASVTPAAQPAQSQQYQASSVQQPQVAAAQGQPTVAAAPAAVYGGGGVVTPGGVAGVPKRALKRPGSTFSINPTRSTSAAASTQQAQAVGEIRNGSYSREQLAKAWQDFIKTRPTEHILINTMRASFPLPVDEAAHVYRMMVENEMQLNIVEQVKPTLLSFVRSAIGNDHFSLSVEINQGEASPHTWNERKVWSHMLETVPNLRGFVEDFGLTLG